MLTLQYFILNRILPNYFNFNQRYYVTKKKSEICGKLNENIELSTVTIKPLNIHDEELKIFSVHLSPEKSSVASIFKPFKSTLKTSEKDTPSLERDLNSIDINWSKSNLIRNAEQARLARMLKKTLF